MKLSSAHINRPRRIFLAVVVALVLVLAWEVSKPWRTGVQEHTLSFNPLVNALTRQLPTISLGGNEIDWYSGPEGNGRLEFGVASRRCEFSITTRSNLLEVTVDDARKAIFNEGYAKPFGLKLGSDSFVIHDGQVILVRHSIDTQTVYALEVVEQRNGVGRFRSRKILPAPGGN